MKKLLILLAFSLTACTTAPILPEETPPVAPAPTVETTPPPATSDVATYNNETYGVSFEYPADWGSPQEVFQNTAEDYFVRLAMPSDDYDGTNFSQAEFSIGATPSDSLDDCLSTRPNGGMADFDKTQPVIFNDNIYYSVSGGDSGMGHWGYLRFYRTYQDQTCFTVEEGLVVTNPAPEYHTTPITELDKDAVWSRLDAILQTVSFDSI